MNKGQADEKRQEFMRDLWRRSNDRSDPPFHHSGVLRRSLLAVLPWQVEGIDSRNVGEPPPSPHRKGTRLPVIGGPYAGAAEAVLGAENNRDLRALVVDLLGVTNQDYTVSQMTYDLRRLRLKGLIFRPPKTHRYFLTPYGRKVAGLFTRLEARVFRPAVAMFTSNDAVVPFPLRASLNRVDAQLDELIYQAFPQAKAC